MYVHIYIYIRINYKSCIFIFEDVVQRYYKKHGNRLSLFLFRFMYRFLCFQQRLWVLSMMCNILIYIK